MSPAILFCSACAAQYSFLPRTLRYVRKNKLNTKRERSVASVTALLSSERPAHVLLAARRAGLWAHHNVVRAASPSTGDAFVRAARRLEASHVVCSQMQFLPQIQVVPVYQLHPAEEGVEGHTDEGEGIAAALIHDDLFSGSSADCAAACLTVCVTNRK